MPRLNWPGLLMALTVTALLANSSQALAGHVQCGDVITQDTTLDSDLIDCPGDGIVIGASGITLDLNGHVIDGTQETPGFDYCNAGLLNVPADYLCPRAPGQSYDDVTVRGGTIREFAFGVLFDTADHATLRDLSISGTSGGLNLGGSRDGLIVANRLSHNGFGMLINDVTHTRISDNVISSSDESGIESEGLEENVVERNLFVRNGNGLHMHAALHNLVMRNRAVDNGGSGLEISDGAHLNQVLRNVASGNGDGITIFEGTHGNRVAHNRVTGNGRWPLLPHDLGGAGIWVDGETQVEHNFVSGNSRGILVCCNDRNSVVRNRVTANREGVVVIDEADSNFIGSNWVTQNLEGGIFVRPGIYSTGATTIDGNHVARNGGDGIFIGFNPRPGAVATSLSRNLTTRNEDDGIQTESPDTVLDRNRATFNGDFGIEAVVGVEDGGGNRAFRNGNPLQCLNIDCR